MDEKDALIYALQQFIEQTLLYGNPEGSLAVVSDDVIGIGMGEQGTVSRKEDVSAILKNANPITNGAYSITYEQIEARCFSGGFGVISARFALIRTLDGQLTADHFIQSASARKIDGRWRLCFLQITPVTITENTFTAYPLQIADLSHLRSELMREAFELANQNLSGGVFGIYIRGRSYPLYFANQSMVHMLGYSREEFYHTFHADTSSAIYPDDRHGLFQEIRKAVRLNQEFEVRYRLLKKDGSCIWVIERGKKTTDHDGNALILAVVTDVTQMMHMQQALEENAVRLEEQAEELSAQNEALLAQRKTLEEKTRALAVSEERFRIALEKTSNIIFDYDVVSGNIMHSSAPKQAMDFITNIADARRNLIIGGTVLDAYVADFEAAFAQIRQGAHRADCIVKVRLATGKEIWSRISMTGVAGPQGNVLRAIGLIEDITKQKEAEIAYKREEQYRQVMLSDAMGIYMVNYSKGIFENCQIMDEHCVAVSAGEPYDAFLRRVAKQRLQEPDRQAFMETFSRASILAAFDEEQHEVKLEYHSFFSDGSDMWIQTTVRLVLDSAANEKKGFLYVMDIDARKRRELAMTLQMETDQLTGVFNKAAAEKHIRDRLSTPDSAASGVFIMIDIDHFKQINDTFGHPFGDKVLKQVAEALRANFRGNDIAGRLGGDEFCVFLNNIASRDRVTEVAKLLCAKIHGIATPFRKTSGVSCSIGISMCDGRVKTFEEIYQQADSALYTVKEKGRDGFAFYGDLHYQKSQTWMQSAEWLLDEMHIAIYVCDTETFDIVYVNRYLLDFLHIQREDCHGKKCYEILCQQNSPCSFCSVKKLERQSTYERTYRMPVFNRLFLMRGQILDWNGRAAHLEIATDITDIAGQL